MERSLCPSLPSLCACPAPLVSVQLPGRRARSRACPIGSDALQPRHERGPLPPTPEPRGTLLAPDPTLPLEPVATLQLANTALRAEHAALQQRGRGVENGAPA